MGFRTVVLTVLMGFSSVSTYALNCKEIIDGLQKKDFIIELVNQNQDHHIYKSIKDLPILAYKIKSSKFSDIPSPIRRVLGAVDASKYTEEYLGQNVGSVIALQM